MNSNAKIPAGFTEVDQNDLTAIEGGNFLGDFFGLLGAGAKAVGDGLSTLGGWINRLF